MLYNDFSLGSSLFIMTKTTIVKNSKDFEDIFLNYPSL